MKLASLVYVQRENKTLMLHRIKKKEDIHEGKYNGVGGKIEDGESPEECAIRETLEETGLKIKNPKLKGILTFPKFLQNEDWIVFVFTTKEFEGKIIESEEGKLEWINNDKLLKLNLWEGDKIFLPLVFKDTIFSGKFIYENKKLIGHKIIPY